MIIIVLYNAQKQTTHFFNDKKHNSVYILIIPNYINSLVDNMLIYYRIQGVPRVKCIFYFYLFINY